MIDLTLLVLLINTAVIHSENIPPYYSKGLHIRGGDVSVLNLFQKIHRPKNDNRNNNSHYHKSLNDVNPNHIHSNNVSDEILLSSSSQNHQSSTTHQPSVHRKYLTCTFVVALWLMMGTIFYSFTNSWPLHQSFFYSVDAGMSIGFCTDVYETKLSSKAFTILYIILGASCVGGALALFIQDTIEGVIRIQARTDYQSLLERNILSKVITRYVQNDTLNYPKFRKFIHELDSIHSYSGDGTYGGRLSFANSNKGREMIIQNIFRMLDTNNDGIINSKEFEPMTNTSLNEMLKLEIHHGQRNPFKRLFRILSSKCIHALDSKNRIYLVFLFWLCLGIGWGMLREKWDFITATHFSISAMATGGLTAPQVAIDGILPLEPSIFCGVYCIFGIPIFALTVGQFALIFVHKHIIDAETDAIHRRLSPTEYDFAKHLCTPHNDEVHLSDFIVFHLLRLGKVDKAMIEVLKEQFELLDQKRLGFLTFDDVVGMSNDMMMLLDSEEEE